MPVGRSAIDMTGQVFGRLTVTSRAGSERTDSGTRAMWKCLCSCGLEIVARRSSLVRGKVRSCGCSRDLLRGEGNIACKLSDNTVREIRIRAAIGHSQRKIAAAFGVSKSTVRMVINRKMWSHVP